MAPPSDSEYKKADNSSGKTKRKECLNLVRRLKLLVPLLEEIKELDEWFLAVITVNKQGDVLHLNVIVLWGGQD
ncbi:hypothetical protein COLO4_33081 [Corchorus olitorius]|uniref:PUB 12/19-like N-terminal domain-containing protein n=1 Tax=Corchorus olitorius TaxID=93759 RepID=A0A1R3GWJ1_9ROSI|nr:hypothetical protein COLO4_33081 [Corchorus olitorius]